VDWREGKSSEERKKNTEGHIEKTKVRKGEERNAKLLISKRGKNAGRSPSAFSRKRKTHEEEEWERKASKNGVEKVQKHKEMEIDILMENSPQDSFFNVGSLMKIRLAGVIKGNSRGEAEEERKPFNLQGF